MEFFNHNCADLARSNSDYRKVLFTTEKTQLVLMCLKPHTEIPKEVHSGDQILIFVEGSGEAILNKQRSPFAPGSFLIVPAGTMHTIKNTADIDLKMYTIYAPPQHAPGTVHKTPQDEK